MLRTLLALLSTLVGVFIVGLLLLSSSETYNDCIRHNGQHETGRYDGHGSAIVAPAIANPTSINLFFDCGGYFAAENGDGITAISTALLTVITLMLFYLAYEQGSTTRAQLRAYISAIPTNLQRLEEGHAAKVTFTIRNTGQTPATEIRAYCLVAVLPYPLPSDYQLPDLPIDAPSTMIAFPGGGPDCDATSSDELTSEQIATIMDGSKGRLYVFGAVKYTDAFKAKRTTKFCAFVGGQELRTSKQMAYDRALSAAPGTSGVVPLSWVYTAQHNEIK